MSNEAAIIENLIRTLGPQGVVLEEADWSAYASDWRGKFTGKPLAIVRPKTSEDVRNVLAVARAHGVGIVPQGGNTGLCGGATPDGGGRQLVLSLGRMNAIRAVDAANNSLVAEAGCVLTAVHEAAAAAGRLFPLSLAAEGSSQIGGLVSTNAGGTAVLRYGNMRDLVLGLEVVLPNGEILANLKGLRKDNTGYDWKQLFIGSEGTLGVVTAATLKLFPRPQSKATVFCALPSIESAIALLRFMQDEWGDSVTTFEVATAACMSSVTAHFPELKLPFDGDSPFFALFEVIAHHMEPGRLANAVEESVGNAAEAELLLDATVAQNPAQARQLWRLREEITESERRSGKSVKHDVSLPIGNIGRFLREAESLVEAKFPTCRLHVFGHLGDGSLHVNLLLAPAEAEQPGFEQRVFLEFHDLVDRHDGSFSAEHGVGQLKVNEMARYKSAAELNFMRQIKAALDPQGLMNPKKLLP